MREVIPGPTGSGDRPSSQVVVRQISVAEAFANQAFPALCREYAAESAIAGLPAPQEKLSAYQALEASGSDAFCAFGAFLTVPPKAGARAPLSGTGASGECASSDMVAPAGADMLIGFIVLLTPVLPHYGAAIAVAESLFVGGAHRKTGAGMLLIRRAERRAREARSPGMLFSAPSGGRLSVLLPRIGYRETNRVYLKGFTYD